MDSIAKFYHARPLHCVIFGPVRGAPYSFRLEGCSCTGDCKDRLDAYHIAVELEAAYRWMEEKVGFWPLFFAVGDEEVIGLTGWEETPPAMRTDVTGATDPMTANDARILFAWYTAPPGLIYTRYDAWCSVLNAIQIGVDRPHKCFIGQIPEEEVRAIFEPSLTESEWIACAVDPSCPFSVQGIVPEIDLGTADEVWCSDAASRNRLVQLGFDATVVTIRT